MAKDTNGELRLPPQNLEAEEAVLGSIMIEKGALDRVVQLLPQGAFYKEAHNHIYAAMGALANVGEPIDVLTLTNYLSKQGLLEQVGGAYCITGLADAVPSAANVGQYAQIVRERWSRRQIISTSTELIESAYQGDSETEEMLDTAEHRLFELQRKTTSTEATDVDTILKDSLSKLDKLASADRKHRYTGIPSGFTDLDKKTNGFQPSDLVIIAGRPSMGKTALALNIARNAAGDEFEHNVGIFSMEMNNYQLAMRLLTAEAKVDSHKVREGSLGKRDWPKISKAAGVLSKTHIFIDDTAGLDILGLRSRIRRFKSDHNVELVIIDYLQLVSGRAKMENRQQEVSDMTRSLKGLARELDIVVLALSQLSRAPEQRTGKDKRPIMSDLRESGAIEQDADVILFLFRPEVYTHKAEDQGKTELIIAKQRNGPTGTVHLTFRNQYTKFESAAFEDDYQLMSEESPF